MTRPEDDRSRVNKVAASGMSRPLLNDKFQSLLQQGAGRERFLLDKEDSDHDFRQSPHMHPGLRDSIQQSPDHSLLSQRMMKSFSDSLQDSSPEREGADSMLNSLLSDISNGIIAGRRISSHKWKLTLRLREDFLNQTNLEISCVSGEFSVLFRTASEEVYQKLVEALPAFNSLLKHRDWGHRAASVFLINVEELQ